MLQTLLKRLHRRRRRPCSPRGGGPLFEALEPRVLLSGSVDFVQAFGHSQFTPTAVAVEADGEVWVAGGTTSGGEWVGGGFDETFNGGFGTPGPLSRGYYGDGFLMKFDADGQPIWSTYYGSEGAEGIRGLALDGKGGVYVVGETSERLWYQGAPEGVYLGPPGGGRDGFLAHFESDGNLDWTKALGGTSLMSTLATDVAVDAAGNIWVGGNTNEGGWIDGTDPNSSTRPAGFYTKFNPQGQPLLNGYLGGTGDTRITAVAVDKQGNAYFGGQSASGEWLNGMYTGTPADGYTDFAAKVSPGGQVLWSTFLGDMGDEGPTDVVVDVSGDVWFIGNDDKNGFIYENFEFADDNGNNYAINISSNGEPLGGVSLAGLLPHSLGDPITHFSGAAADPRGGVLLTGFTDAREGIATVDAFDADLNDSAFGSIYGDMFLASVRPGGKGLRWASYFGGDGHEAGELVAFHPDQTGTAYVVGMGDTSTPWDDGPLIRGGGSQIAGFLARVSGIPGSDTSPVSSGADFDANGTPDIVWRNTATGQNTLMLMDGDVRLGWATLPTVATAWTLGGVADMDDNGTPDLIWRNTLSGENTIMLMGGTSRTGWASLPKVATAWTLGGVADMDGNGHADLVFRNTISGENTIMRMDATQRIGWASLPKVDRAWTLGGVADMDSNGSPDLLWRNTATGENTIMRMSGVSRIGWSPLPTVATAWSLAGVADFNADGSPDLLFRNPASGLTTMMRMSGTARLGWTGLPTVTAGWTPRV